MNDRRPGITLPAWDEVKTRLFMTGLFIIAFVLAGLWLNTTGWLAVFSTVVVVTLSMVIHSFVKGTPIDRPEKERQALPETERLLSTVREAPLLRPLATSSAARVFAAIGVGVAVALGEFFVRQAFFGGDKANAVGGILSLSLVVFPLYAGIGLYEARWTYPEDGWASRTRTALLEWIRAQARIGPVVVNPYFAALLWATGRTLISALLRALTILILAPIFDNWWAIGTIAALGLIMVVGGIRFLSEAAQYARDVTRPVPPPKM